jgi:hypothetical protein
MNDAPEDSEIRDTEEIDPGEPISAWRDLSTTLRADSSCGSGVTAITPTHTVLNSHGHEILVANAKFLEQTSTQQLNLAE